MKHRLILTLIISSLSGCVALLVWHRLHTKSEEALLEEANRYFADYVTKVSSGSGEKLSVHGPARGLIRLELYKKHLAQRAREENPEEYAQARNAFAAGGPVKVVITTTDPMTGVERETHFVQTRGRACGLLPRHEAFPSFASAKRSHSCLKEGFDPNQPVNLIATPLAAHEEQLAFDRHWRDLVAQRHLAAR